MAEQTTIERKPRPCFTPEQAREAGRKSALARRQRSETERQRKADMAEAIQAFTGASIGQGTLHAVAILVQSAIAGDIPVPENALERKRLAETAEILHRIARLELGESTSNQLTVSGDLSDLEARRQQLLARLGVGDVVDVPAPESPAGS